MYIGTTALNKILALKKRLKVIQGGTSAGKTIAILMVLIDRAQNEPNKLFSVVSESFPHLRRGAIRDFLNIMEGAKFFKDSEWNKTEYIYKFSNGSQIEFFSADQPGKVRGPRRDVLFENEANNIPYETHTQLAIRTKEDIYIDYNPVTEFWVHTEIIPKLEHDFLILTYKDNEGLPDSIVSEIEARRVNKSWFRVYGEGLVGEIEGKIFKNWQIIDEVPGDARLMRRGLDFGFSNDPAALVDVYKWNQGYVIDEQLYQLGKHNREIAELIKLLPSPSTLIIADSAEPKSIDEMKSYGLSILPSTKGPGSVKRGIDYVQDQVVYVTKQSVNTIKEYRNYIWLVDKDGKVLNEEDPRCANHSMSAIRYALDSLKPQATEIMQAQAQMWQRNKYQRELNSTK